MGWKIKDFDCRSCGVTERLVETNVSRIVCCGKVAHSLIGSPRIIGTESYNPHFDITQGQFFGSLEQKNAWLKKKEKEQVEGHASPRSSGGGRILCTKEQASKLIGANAREVKQSDLPLRTTNRRTSLPEW